MSDQRSAVAVWRRNAANVVPIAAMSAIQRIQEWMTSAVVCMESRYHGPPVEAPIRLAFAPRVLERGFGLAHLLPRPLERGFRSLDVGGVFFRSASALAIARSSAGLGAFRPGGALAATLDAGERFEAGRLRRLRQAARRLLGPGLERQCLERCASSASAAGCSPSARRRSERRSGPHR